MSSNIVLVVRDPILRVSLRKLYTVVADIEEVPKDNMVVLVDLERASVTKLHKGIVVIAPKVSDIKVEPRLSELKIDDQALRSILVTGSIVEGRPVLECNGVDVCCEINNVIVCSCKVLLPYLLSHRDLVLRELKLVQSHLFSRRCKVDLERAVRELRKIIIGERRKHKISRTLALLTELSLGKREVLDKLPTHVLDILSDVKIVDISSRRVNVDALRLLLRRLEKQIYVQ